MSAPNDRELSLDVEKLNALEGHELDSNHRKVLEITFS
jgi:hypothetical protein